MSILLALAGCDSSAGEKPNASEETGGKDGGPSTGGKRDAATPVDKPDDVGMVDPHSAGMVMGVVTDVSGNHLPDAVVSLAGKSVMSGPDGVFELGELTADPELPLLVTLDGYSTGRARLDVVRGQDNYVKVVLMENEVMSLADVSKGAKVESKSGVTIDLPAGSVVDKDGNMVQGPIEVKIALLNDRDEIAAAPGNMMAQNPNPDRADEVETPLESFGMVEINLVDSQGREVNLKGDADVPLRFPLAPNHSFKPGDDVPLWHYDEGMNLWNLIGNGVVQDDNTFLASVRHFSWWNADQVLTKTCVIGRVLDASGNPVPAAQMNGEGRSYLGSSRAVTGEDGSFCMEARVSSVIEVATTVRVRDAAQALAVRVNTPRTTGSCGQPSSCFMIDDLVAVADQPLCDPAQCPQEPGKTACCTTDLGPCAFVVNGDCGGSADGSWDPEPEMPGVEAVPGVPLMTLPGSDAGTSNEDAGTQDAGTQDAGTDAGTQDAGTQDAAVQDASTTPDAATDASTGNDASTGGNDAGMDGSVDPQPDASTGGNDASSGSDSSVPDASVGDGGHDGGSPVVDLCADAVALVDLEPVTGTSEGSTLLNDWWDGGSCNSYLPGFERVYSVSVPAGATLRARAVGSADFATVIATDCADVINSCASGRDSARTRWTNEGQVPFTVFVIVDSAQINGAGEFKLYLSSDEESCGDGLLDWSEQCDDGNDVDLDGCDQLCDVEPGFVCPPTGTCRGLVCGDSVVDGGSQYANGHEQCDDGDAESLDGCSSSCMLEPNWVCEEPGQPCRPIVCGDGLVDMPHGGGGGASPKPDGGVGQSPSVGEQCDDMNTNAEDGCSASCQVEPGYVCDGTPSVCEERPAGDLCENALALLPGSHDLSAFNRDYYMGSGPDILFSSNLPVGQLLVVSGTATFNGYATLSHAGMCPSSISMERRIAAGQPFTLAFDDKGEGSPGGTPVILWFQADNAGTQLNLTISSVTTATPACGDGVVSPSLNELCDDGNTLGSDGCTAQCQREPGYHCPFEGGACRPVVCGDEMTDWPHEDCEDGNVLDGDGCSSDCRTEPGYLCDWFQMQCELRDSGDLCNNADALPAFSQDDYSMTGMTADRLCQGGGECMQGYTRWFTFTQQPGDVTRALLSSDFYGDVDVYELACPVDGYTNQQIGGTSLYPSDSSELTVHNPSGLARTVFMRVTSYTSADGSFHMALKTGAPGCGDGIVSNGGPSDGPGNGGTVSLAGPGPMLPSETCDDMNQVGGDGCSATCRQEPGYRCSWQGGACMPMECGDGVLDQPNGPSFELCDDGNGANGDGCSSSCMVEPGANCSGYNPSECSNTIPGDVCSNALPLQPGDTTRAIDAFTHDIEYMGGTGSQTAWFTITLQPRQVLALTSSATFNGYINIFGLGLAGCDHRYYVRGGPLGNQQPMIAENLGSGPLPLAVRVQVDGMMGTVTGSFTLNSSVFVPPQDCSGSECVNVVCGDGAINGTEQCDDENTSNGDGCSAICTRESTHVCSGEPSECVSALAGDSCGNALSLANGTYSFSGYAPEPSCQSLCGGSSRWFKTIVPAWHTIAVRVSSSDTYGSTRFFDLGAPCWVAELGSGETNGPVDSFGEQDMYRALVNDSPIARAVGFAVVDGDGSNGSFTLTHTVEPLGCGDGYADTRSEFGTHEACDDGGHASGDGCSPTCQPEAGWDCDYDGHCVQVVCGDGIVNGTEQCDDSNDDGADGCSASCALEPGYLCGGEPYACHQTQSGDICQNAEAFVDGSYTLDGYLPDFGCHNMCGGPDRWFSLTVPAGQVLTVAVQSTTLSGDVRLYDMTYAGCATWMSGQGGDAYNAGHTGRIAWVNAGEEPSTIGVAVSNNSGGSGTFALSHALRAIGCGDGYVDTRGDHGPVEQCDDRNGLGNDGCSASCQREEGWLCSNDMPTHCVQPPPGDMCESAELLQTGEYSLEGFNNECGLGGCNPDRWLETTVASGELLVLDVATNASFAYARLWDLSSHGTCDNAQYVTASWLGSNQPAQLVWQAPPGGGKIAVQLENGTGEPTTELMLGVHIGLPACGDGFADYGGMYGMQEDCDDGNNLDEDECPSNCQWPID